MRYYFNTIEPQTLKWKWVESPWDFLILFPSYVYIEIVYHNDNEYVANAIEMVEKSNLPEGNFHDNVHVMMTLIMLISF